MKKIAGYGSISQSHGSTDPDPDPHQNVMDPQHCCIVTVRCTLQGNTTQENALLRSEGEIQAMACSQRKTQEFLLSGYVCA